jgi:diguanylate cyclase (GGDEF)-like protein/PAS domain S-box-containing protein
MINSEEDQMTEQLEKLSSILIVDDNSLNISLLEIVLSASYLTRSASQGNQALNIAREVQPDLILLDIMMPEMDGYEVCKHLKDDPLLRDIPVIFLSILESTEIKVKAFKAGGVDYITKPFQADEVLARVGTHLMLRNLQHRLEAQNRILEQTIVERTHLAMIVESSNDAIFSVSLDDVILSWNRGAEIIFGYSAEEIIGEQIFAIIPGELHNNKSHILHTLLRGEQIQHFETARTRKDGVQIHVSVTISPLQDASGALCGYSIIACDVTGRKEMEEIIRHQAFHDTLTGLPNRQLFMDLLSLGLAQARRNRKKLALLFLDLNGFKQVNDRLGHSFGDLLLQEVARRLKASVRVSDTVARFGGDEFTVLMPDLARTDDVGIVLRKIMGVFESPFMLDGVEVSTSASIGVCMFPDDGDCCEELIKNADIAMYEAKCTDGNSYQFHNSRIDTRTIDTLAMGLRKTS